MAFSSYYQPDSYADLYYNSPYGYVPRRTSPPPSAYYPFNPYDRYSQELAREQAARATLQKAAQQERARRAAMAARAEEQRRQRAIEQARREREAKMRAQQQRCRPQSFFGFPFFEPSADEADADYAHVPSRPSHSWTAEPQTETFSGRSPIPVHVQSDSSAQPKATSTGTAASTMSSDPAHDMQKMEEAAATIQTAFRKHAALKRISAIRERFSALLSSFTLPPRLSFQPESYSDELGRGKLAYNKENGAVHVFIDDCERMLQELDAIESRGALDVRESRKELVRDIEEKLRSVEEEVKKAWEVQQMMIDTDDNAQKPAVEVNGEVNGAQIGANDAPTVEKASHLITPDATMDTTDPSAFSSSIPVVAAESTSPVVEGLSEEAASTSSDVPSSLDTQHADAVEADDVAAESEASSVASEIHDAPQTSVADTNAEKVGADTAMEAEAEEGQEIEDALMADVDGDITPAAASIEPSEQLVQETSPEAPSDSVVLSELTGQEEPRGVASEVDEKDFVMV